MKRFFGTLIGKSVFLAEKIMHYKAECQRLTGYLEEQRAIYSDNVGKFFGEGARKKKEAKQ